jgi:hypothetical protein
MCLFTGICWSILRRWKIEDRGWRIEAGVSGPDILAGEIIENIEAGLEGVKDLMETINGGH